MIYNTKAREMAARLLTGERFSVAEIVERLPRAKTEGARYDGNLPVSMTHWPIVRTGDVVDVDLVNGLAPKEGGMVLAAVDVAKPGYDACPVLALALVVPHVKGTRLQVDGWTYPIEDCSVVGVVTCHTYRPTKSEVRSHSCPDGLSFVLIDAEDRE